MQPFSHHPPFADAGNVPSRERVNARFSILQVQDSLWALRYEFVGRLSFLVSKVDESLTIVAARLKPCASYRDAFSFSFLAVVPRTSSLSRCAMAELKSVQAPQAYVTSTIEERASCTGTEAHSATITVTGASGACAGRPEKIS